MFGSSKSSIVEATVCFGSEPWFAVWQQFRSIKMFWDPEAHDDPGSFLHDFIWLYLYIMISYDFIRFAWFSFDFLARDIWFRLDQCSGVKTPRQFRTWLQTWSQLPSQKRWVDSGGRMKWNGNLWEHVCPKPAFMGDCLSYYTCARMLAAYETAAEWRETKAGQCRTVCSTLGGIIMSPDSKAMDGAFAALSWDDSAVKAN